MIWYFLTIYLKIVRKSVDLKMKEEGIAEGKAQERQLCVCLLNLLFKKQLNPKQRRKRLRLKNLLLLHQQTLQNSFNYLIQVN